MIDFKEILKYIQKTNPNMTEDRLIEELSKTPSSTVCLFLIAKNK